MFRFGLRYIHALQTLKREREREKKVGNNGVRVYIYGVSFFCLLKRMAVDNGSKHSNRPLPTINE